MATVMRRENNIAPSWHAAPVKMHLGLVVEDREPAQGLDAVALGATTAEHQPAPGGCCPILPDARPAPPSTAPTSSQGRFQGWRLGSVGASEPVEGWPPAAAW